jgi:hypothetical protein
VSLTTTFASYWLVLILPLSALLSIWLYYKDPILKDQSLVLRILLTILRFLALAILGVLLLEPMIKTQTFEKQKPIIAVVLDASASMLNYSDSAYVKNNLEGDLTTHFSNLGATYDVDFYQFGKELENWDSVSFDYSGTDISKALEGLNNRYFGQNLNGIVLATDGNYTQGINPLYTPFSSLAPIYPILIGDTLQPNDLKITYIQNNSIAFLKDEFPVEIGLEAYALKNQKYTLRLYHKGEVLRELTSTITSSNWSTKHRFFLPATDKGMQRYRVVVETNESQNLTKNNRESFYIEVIDERLKIAIVTSFPHPDVGAWKSLLIKVEAYNVKVIRPEDFSPEAGFELFILFQGPIKSEDLPHYKAIQNASKPMLAIVGNSTQARWFNQVVPMFSIQTQGDIKEEFEVELSPSFDLFEVEPSIKKYLDDAAPLHAKLFSLSAGVPYQEVLTKRIGKLNTEQPLWALSMDSDPKVGVFLGEGIWRWRIHANATQKQQESFDAFLRQSVQYLIRKNRKKQFDIEVQQPIQQGEVVRFTAEVLNPSMEYVNGADIELNIESEDGQSFEYAFIEQNGTYGLDIKALNPGNYSFIGEVEMQGKTFTDSGIFTVQEITREQKNLRANYELLVQMAANSNGTLYTFTQLEQLAKELEGKNIPIVGYSSETYRKWISLEWIFFIIFAALSIEWFLRRYFGTY